MMIGEGFKQVEAKYAGTKFPNYGCKVLLTLCLSTGKETTTELRNVTEIHYNYQHFGTGPRSGRIAFESDVHYTGQTWPFEDVVEFTTIAETEIAEGF